MLKVFILGYDEPYSVVGRFLFEDERFLHLEDGGKKIKIPHKRIAYIEDWSAFSATDQVDTPSSAPIISKVNKTNDMGSSTVSADRIKQVISDAPRDAVEDLGKQLKEVLNKRLAEQQAAAMRSSQVEPEDLEQPVSVGESSTESSELLIIFTGAKTGQFPLIVPSDTFAGQYTPTLGREIFKAPQIQSFMSSDIILDGLPLISGTTIQFRTKPAKTMGDITGKLDVMGKMLAIGNSTLLNQVRKSPFDQGFSMPGSPFETLPNILGKPKDESDTEE